MLLEVGIGGIMKKVLLYLAGKIASEIGHIVREWQIRREVKRWKKSLHP